MNLKQIKDFTSETITQELAAQLFAIVGLQKAFNKEKYKGTFTVEEEWKGRALNHNGGTYSDDWKDPNYTREGYERVRDGVTITCSEVPSHKCRIWSNGRGQMYIFHKKGEIRSHYTGDSSRGIPPKTEYYEEFTSYHEYSSDPIQLIQLYINNGFYTIE